METTTTPSSGKFTGDLNINKIRETLQNQRAVFVSGEYSIKKWQLDRYYIPRLEEEIKNGSYFVLGNSPGVDHWCQRFLGEQGVDSSRVFVLFCEASNQYDFRMADKYGFNQRLGGFKSPYYRDIQMTILTRDDIVYSRKDNETQEFCKKIGIEYQPDRACGSQQNQQRRNDLHNGNVTIGQLIADVRQGRLYNMDISKRRERLPSEQKLQEHDQYLKWIDEDDELDPAMRPYNPPPGTYAAAVWYGKKTEATVD